jgi:ADP-glucose pyrophosphorylase
MTVGIVQAVYEHRHSLRHHRVSGKTLKRANSIPPRPGRAIGRQREEASSLLNNGCFLEGFSVYYGVVIERIS